MKKLEESITKILSDNTVSTTGALTASPIDIVKEILEAINEYFRTIEEATCYLLELLPDGEASITRKVTDTCSLRYSISKE